MTRRRFIQQPDGTLLEVSLDYVAPTPNGPMVMPDIKPYTSMATGEVIGSRSIHREHLKRHHLVEIGNETKYLKPKPKEKPPGLRDAIARAVYQKFGY